MPKKIRYIIILLFLIAVCFFFGKRMYISHIEGEINKNSGLSVDIGALAFYKLIWGQVDVRDFNIRNPYEYKFKNAVTVRKIDIFLPMDKIFSNHKIVDSIVISGMNVNYFIKKDANNISELINTASETTARKLDELIKKAKGKNGPGSLQINNVRIINSTLTLFISGNQPVVVPLRSMTFDDLSGNKGNIYIVIIKGFIEILQKVVNVGLNSQSLKIFNSLDNVGNFNNDKNNSKNEVSDLISKLAN
ncbi:MAG: AsmA family protein [bacterium]|nr:AsmA family protein [bacterium]